MFTTEHYKVLALIMKGAMTQRYELVHHYILRCLVEAFKEDNPEFDQGKFLVACGVPEECL